jgi:hypothetical protein
MPKSNPTAPSPSTDSRPQMIVTVRLPLPDKVQRSFKVPFRQLADGTFASDALLAVRWGGQGRKVYAEAIHRRTMATPSLTVGSDNLRGFRDLVPTIIGWADRGKEGLPTFDPGRRPLVRLSAEPALWDGDWVSTPFASAAVAPPAVARPLTPLARPRPFVGQVLRMPGVFEGCSC